MVPQTKSPHTQACLAGFGPNAGGLSWPANPVRRRPARPGWRRARQPADAGGAPI